MWKAKRKALLHGSIHVWPVHDSRKLVCRIVSKYVGMDMYMLYICSVNYTNHMYIYICSGIVWETLQPPPSVVPRRTWYLGISDMYGESTANAFFIGESAVIVRRFLKRNSWGISEHVAESPNHVIDGAAGIDSKYFYIEGVMLANLIIRSEKFLSIPQEAFAADSRKWPSHVAAS